MGKEYQIAFAIGAKLQGQFSSAFKGAQKEIASLQGEISSLNKTQGDISAYQKQQAAIERTEGKLSTLKQQYENLKTAMNQSGDASAQLKNQMLQKGLQIEQTTQKLSDQEARLGTLGSALSEAGVDTNNLASASAELSGQIAELSQQQEELADSTEESNASMQKAAQAADSLLGALGITEVLKEIYSAFKECASAAIDFEQSMAGVRRTVGGSDEFLSELASSFKEMSTEMPIVTSDLASIATTAGQLGIAQNKVEQFTQVMAQLATTTDLTADEAATMLAQFSNITGVTDFQRMGSVVADLGDATATTASKVVEMSQGMAAAASIAGFSATDIMALAASVGSLGIEAQAGSTSMSQLISTLYMAVETGENLKEFASVANMSAQQFKEAWGQDAVGAMNAFIQGLNDTERNGRSAIVILNELGINNVRQTKAILGLAKAGDLLSRTVSQASAAWEANTALSQKASIMYETTQSKLTMMNNEFNNLKIAIGDAFTPIIGEAAGMVSSFVSPITEYIEANPALVKALGAAATVIATVTAAITAYVAITKVAAIVSAAFTTAIPGVGLILGVAGAIAALVGGVTYFTSSTADATEAAQEVTKSFEDMQTEFDDAMSGYKRSSELSRLADRYNSLNSSISDTKAYLASLGSEDVDISLTATAIESVAPEEFLINESVTVDGLNAVATEDEALLVDPNDLVKDEDILLAASEDEEALLNPEALVDGETVLLRADPNEAELLSQQDFVKKDAALISGQLDGEAKIISQDDFVSDAAALISGKRDGESELIAQDAFVDSTAALISAQRDTNSAINAQEYIVGVAEIEGQNGNTIDYQSFINVESEEAKIQGKAIKELSNQDFMAENSDAARISAEPGVYLTDTSFYDSESGEAITLYPQYETLGADAFYDGSAVILTAQATQNAEGRVDPSELVNGTDVALSASVAEEFEGLKPEAFVTGNEVKLIAELDTEDALKALETLQGKLDMAKDDLIVAKNDLADMNQRYSELQARLKRTTGEETKSQLRSEMEALSSVISEQEGKVNQLEQVYREANTAYETAAVAANSLAEQEAELAGIKAQLAALGFDVADATDAETESMQNQLLIAKEMAEFELAANRGKMKNSLYEQTKTAYAEQYNAYDEYGGAFYKDRWKKYTDLESAYANMSADQMYQVVANAWQNAIEEGSTGFKDTRAYDILEIMTGDRFGAGSALSDKTSFTDYLSEKDINWNAVTKSQGLDAIAAGYKDDYDRALSVENAMSSYLDNLVEYVTDGGGTVAEVESILRGAFEEVERTGTNNAYYKTSEGDTGFVIEDAVAYAMEYVNAAIEVQNANAQMAQSTLLTAEQATTAIQPIIDQMNALGDAYNAAYEDAYNSMDGQFKLFESVEAIAPSFKDAEKAVNDYINALESQAAYMAQYRENLLAVKEMGLSDTLVAELSDGSTESAAILANIVKSGSGYIDDLNTAFASVEQGKEDFANTVAEMQTNFSTQMAALETQLAATVENMNLSSEAAEAAASTVQAFADAAEGKVSVVSTAFSKVAAAASAALKITGGEVQHNASGTDSAERGWSWVGENGPELVWLNGGERIMDAQESQAFMDAHRVDAEPISAMPFASRGGDSYVVTVSPEYNISGGMDADSVRQALDDNTDRLRDLIEATIDEIEENRERSVYSQ